MVRITWYKYVIRLVVFCIVLVSCKSFLFGQNGKIYPIRATYYHDKFENRKTSSGEVFSQKLYTAAHKTIPFHTIVRVTNKKTGKSVLVKVNDRCGKNGILDLSKVAAQQIGLNGTATVQLEVLGKEYVDIWEQQNKLFADSVLSVYDVSARVDSLVEDKRRFGPNLYYVRVATVDGYIAAQSLADKLPQKYQNKLKLEKVYNENFYYVNIGPFQTQSNANSVVEDIKKISPFAHVIKERKL